MRARLGFALVAFTDADVLLLDEVMSVGDQEFRERSEAKITELIRSGRTVVLSSHNVEKLVDVCHSLVRLEGGRVVDVGEPAEVAERYLDRRRAMRAAAAQS
jgi:ABC-type polysaccharide/polyol phosphate transport system ATPase subunit